MSNRLRSSRNAASTSDGGPQLQPRPPLSPAAAAAARLESRINATSQRALDKINSTFDNFKTQTIPRAETRIKEKIDDMPPVLTNAQLRNLDSHKYSATGSTLLDPLFQIYWRWLVEKMPLWVAPNLLTVVGLALNVFTSTLLMLYSPNCDNDVSFSISYKSSTTFKCT